MHKEQAITGLKIMSNTYTHTKNLSCISFSHFKRPPSPDISFKLMCFLLFRKETTLVQQYFSTKDLYQKTSYFVMIKQVRKLV